MTARENSNQLRHSGLWARALSYLIGARSVNMVVRKVEEIRLALWLEKEMRERFDSKRRAKEEILARYVSLVYMGNGQYGLARAADYYFGRRLATFTADDADKAALLAGAIKSARYYAPNGSEIERVLQRRNQVLGLMAANGSFPPEGMSGARQRPIEVVAKHKDRMLQSSAIVENVLEELKTRHADLSVKDLLQGRIQVYSTADARVQQIVTLALEHGLSLYEKRHPIAEGLIQGSVIVLRKHDANILAEAGGRQIYKDRSASYSDFNRVTKSLRQPGSTMKPIVYLADSLPADVHDRQRRYPQPPPPSKNNTKRMINRVSITPPQHLRASIAPFEFFRPVAQLDLKGVCSAGRRLSVRQRSLREIPSFRMIAFKVVRGTPRRLAAVLTTPLVSRSTRTICSRST